MSVSRADAASLSLAPQGTQMISVSYPLHTVAGKVDHAMSRKHHAHKSYKVRRSHKPLGSEQQRHHCGSHKKYVK
jgi:hypothetical protein